MPPARFALLIGGVVILALLTLGVGAWLTPSFGFPSPMVWAILGAMALALRLALGRRRNG